MDEEVDEWMDEKMDEWMDEKVDEWMDVKVDEWMNRLMDECACGGKLRSLNELKKLWNLGRSMRRQRLMLEARMIKNIRRHKRVWWWLKNNVSQRGKEAGKKWWRGRN